MVNLPQFSVEALEGNKLRFLLITAEPPVALAIRMHFYIDNNSFGKFVFPTSTSWKNIWSKAGDRAASI